MNRIAALRLVPTAVALSLSLTAAGCRNVPDPAFTQLAEARRLADDLRIQLAKSSDASDRAVMAETDEESAAFAREADQAAGAIESKSAALSARLQSLGYAPEQHALQDFTERFAAYRKLDHDVLDLAVQNTNLKAQRLSFGPVRETADGFRDDLQAAAQLAPAKDRCRVDGLVARAELAVREIQILQAPHIAEPDEAAMTKIEKQMTDHLAAAREALKSLGAGASAAMAKQLDAASAALDHFDKLSAELVALSRRNSNVRSLALALRRAPELVAACDGSLAILQEALAKEGFSGTR
ncbi:MAG TPA: hypothetical protein VLA79_17515 [Polyangia bacterium]|nr:hypothetical protein [Polyangia bacterium]